MTAGQRSVMERYLNIIRVVNKGMDLVAGTALVLIMLLTTCDVVLRYLGHPILGSYDLVSFGAAFVIGFALPRTSWEKMHITVDILVEKIPHHRFIVDIVTRAMALALFVLIGWNLILMGTGFFETGEETLTLGIPLFPIAYALGFCAFLQCFSLIGDVVRIVLQRRPA
jgi:TRAP-type C4-dicarboxylate transport system permease small subunit